MPDPACFTHAGGRHDHFWRFVKVNRLGFIAGDGQMQARERDWIDSLPHQFHRRLIETFINIMLKNLRRLHGKRAVHINREIPMPGNHILFFYFP